MSLHVLDFAKIIILSDEIAEVIVNEGVVMDGQIAEELETFLNLHLAAPFSVLVNKVNSYTYKFCAQLKLANFQNFHAIAVVTYDNISKIRTEVLRDTTPANKDWNLQLFSTRELAVEWLEVEQEKTRYDDLG